MKSALFVPSGQVGSFSFGDKGPFSFGDFARLSFGCGQGLLGQIKTGLFAKGQILNCLPHDLQSAVIFASLGLQG